MGNLAVSAHLLEKYFKVLFQFDRNTKKTLIERLSKSLEKEPKQDPDLNGLYGAWRDNRDSDQIIFDIRSTRLDRKVGPEFE